MAAISKKAANAVKIRSLYDSDDRVFICNDDSVYFFNRRYRYIEDGLRRFHFAKGNVGIISDCYILYVVALWGMMDFATMLNTLQNYHARFAQEGRLIPEYDEESLEARVKILVQNGLLFRNVYRTAPTDSDLPDNLCWHTLYCVPKEGLALMNVALKKVIYPRPWIEGTREQEAIGLGSAAYAASLFTAYDGFSNLLDGAVRTKEVGTTNISAELEFDIKGSKTRIGFLSLYLVFDTRIQSEREYHIWITNKMNLIRNYFYTRKNYDPVLILVCEDNEDLDKFIKYFSKNEDFMNTYLDKIYFANEGALKVAPNTPNKMLLQYLPNSTVEGGYEFVNSPIKGIK